MPIRATSFRGVIVPLALKQGGIPFVDDGGASIRLVKTLTEKDLGPSALSIDEDGRFYPPAHRAKRSWFKSLLAYLKKPFSRVSNGP